MFVCVCVHCVHMVCTACAQSCRGGSCSGVEGSVEQTDGNREVPSLILDSPRDGVESVLEQVFQPQISPDVQAGALHDFLQHRCMYKCVCEWVNVQSM